MNKTQIEELTEKATLVMNKYKEEFPETKMDRDYFPFKVTEEWGECMQAYLMLTNRGRQKNKDKDEIKKMFSQEFADVFGYLLLFAQKEGVDVAKELDDKWFAYLKENK